MEFKESESGNLVFFRLFPPTDPITIHPSVKSMPFLAYRKKLPFFVVESDGKKGVFPRDHDKKGMLSVCVCVCVCVCVPFSFSFRKSDDRFVFFRRKKTRDILRLSCITIG